MPTPPDESPVRQKYLARLEDLNILPAARPYHVRGAESWTKARAHQSAAATLRANTSSSGP